MPRPPPPPRDRIATRVARLDWKELERSLHQHGWAVTPPVLRAAECRALISLWDDEDRFRKHVDMERHRFGVGAYRYFRRPLPPLVRALRTSLYRRLAPIANRMQDALGRPAHFPPALAAFERQCRRQGQAEPTPLLLRYEAGGFNNLHRDLYGTLAFPLQVTAFLSRPGRDFAGGEFLLVEQRPRQQSVGSALQPPRGALVVFPTAERPAPGRSGFVRAGMRHGVSRITRGTRLTLGVIFHDARS